jgi:hypothetical protein
MPAIFVAGIVAYFYNKYLNTNIILITIKVIYMTRFLKGSALIACLLSSFSMTAIAGYVDGKTVKIRVVENLFEKIAAKKKSNNLEERRDAERIEKAICSKLPQHCEGKKLVERNIAELLNKDSSEEARSLISTVATVDEFIEERN